MRTFIVLLCAGMLLMTAVSSYAASCDEILGVWLNQEKDAKIDVFKCANKYCGKIVYLNEPNYPKGSKDGVSGTPKLDHNNSNPAKRKAPVIGLQIVHDFSCAGDNTWTDGKVYDPKNGKTYSGKMTLVSPSQLNLRGFIGFSFIGRTTTWTR
jgi:uncharacterized protein (DUF2147 family)